MTREITCDLAVIGAGSAGLSVAAGASQMGSTVVLIERAEMGGDCLNAGCVPSKALIHAAHHAHAAREASRFGVTVGPVSADLAQVRAHVRDVIASIAPMDSQARFEGLGCTVLRGAARFTGDRTLAVEDGPDAGVQVKARRVVIATGSTAIVPPIPGLDQTPHWTNETLFTATETPSHLVILGGGPIGMEMAQAHARLGVPVTLVDSGQPLGRDEPDLVRQLIGLMRAEGVTILEGSKVTATAPTAEGVSLTLETPQSPQTLTGSHLLVAVGRRPVTDGLDLSKAGVDTGADGRIVVDKRLRTTNRRISAMGDAIGPPFFTHRAGYHAGIIIRNLLFRLPAKVDERALPRVTYTDPELAAVGLTEAEARATGEEIQILRWSLHENDRAQAMRRTEGQIKVILDRKGRVLGASLLAPQAGELIQPWIMAVADRQKIGKLAGIIAPYPTLAEVSKRVAGSWYVPKLFSARTRRIVRLLARLG